MSRKPDVQDSAPPLPPEKAERIRGALDNVLGSHLFRGSRRCQSLLRHLIEQTLTGQTGSLKERTLGVEVFGRAPDYDTSQDPIVRASAAEIRKKLAQYYQETGHESEARIELASGSYIAEFHFNGGNQAAVAQPRRRSWALAGSCAAAAVLILSVALGAPRWKRSDLDRLWGPLLKAPGTVLICMGQPVTFNLRSAKAQDAIQGFGPATPPHGRPQPVIGDADLVVVRDRYVALGDAICLVHLTSLLERYGKPYRIRGRAVHFVRRPARYAGDPGRGLR